MSGPYFAEKIIMADCEGKKIFEMNDIYLGDKWELDEFLKHAYAIALVLNSELSLPYKVKVFYEGTEIHLFDGRSFVKSYYHGDRCATRKQHRCVDGIIDEGTVTAKIIETSVMDLGTGEAERDVVVKEGKSLRSL